MINSASSDLPERPNGLGTTPAQSSPLVHPPLGQRRPQLPGSPSAQKPTPAGGTFAFLSKQTAGAYGQPQKEFLLTPSTLVFCAVATPFPLLRPRCNLPGTGVPSPPGSRDPKSAPQPGLHSPGLRPRCSWLALGNSHGLVPSPVSPESAPVSAGTSLPPLRRQHTMAV